MTLSYKREKREYRIRAPIPREKKVINTRTLLEEAELDSLLDDQEDQDSEPTEDEILESQDSSN